MLCERSPGPQDQRAPTYRLEDVDEYTAGKNAVLAKILKHAGLSEAERSEIAVMNPTALD
jgi:hypothetical protein